MASKSFFGGTMGAIVALLFVGCVENVEKTKATTERKKTEDAADVALEATPAAPDVVEVEKAEVVAPVVQSKSAEKDTFNKFDDDDESPESFREERRHKIAAIRLEEAKRLGANNVEYRRRLQEVVDEYPATSAASEASRLLESK